MNLSKTRDGLSLLLIDDDAELCSMMKEFFSQADHHLDCSYNGRDGLALALKGNYDLVLLDVMLPMISGLTLLQQLRQRKTTPVIMLTGRVHRNDRIMGLNIGADDYLPKPFDPDELLARIYAVLRRTGRLEFSSSPAKSFGSLRIDLQTREAWNGDRLIELTEMEFDILQLLVSSAGRIVDRDEITATLLGREASPYERALDVHISHLRRKLENSRTLIRTIRGAGYIFVAASEAK